MRMRDRLCIEVGSLLQWRFLLVVWCGDGVVATETDVLVVVVGIHQKIYLNLGARRTRSRKPILSLQHSTPTYI